MTTFPAWLRSPDPERDPDYVRRAAFAYPHRELADRPLPEPVDVTFDIEWAEREAARVLA
jgi:hypothetical protein